ncbi:hypothetical protein ACB092_11G000700 [Castanea dentata]
MMLMHAVVGSMILIKHRVMTEVFPSSWRNLWKEWELRGMILTSLSTQIFLVLLGNSRRRSSGILLTITVWSAYLLADSIATMASSILSNILGDVHKDGDLDPNDELKAFWAPFFLLHLGGTDIITAYSLEDNELWRRHLFGLISQAVTIFYILHMAWTSSHLSFLFIVMFLVGLVKYLERIWVLYSATENKFRDSIPDIPTNESKIMEDCKLKQFEGYHLTKHSVLEVEVPDHSSNQSFPDADEIVTACNLHEMVKRLFADLILGIQERDASRAIFEHKDMDSDKAFKIIEIELGFIYDLLYTKAKVVYSYMGIGRRIIGFLSILIVFATLTLYEILDRDKQHHYRSKIDLSITMVVLAFALLLELCAFAQLIHSDHTAYWLIKHKKSNILRVIKRWAPKKKEHRWSNSISHLSMLHLSLNKTHLHCRPILKMLGIEEMLEIHYAMTTRSLSYKSDIKKKVFEDIKYLRHWAEEYGYGTERKDLFGHRGGRVLQKLGHLELEWSIQLEFDQSILTWHLATDILYHNDYEQEPREDRVPTLQHARGIYLSRYMLYLLVKHPYILPIGMAHINFQDIYVRLKDFIEKLVSKPVKDISHPEEAAKKLIQVSTDNMHSLLGNNKSCLVISRACKLAKELNDTGGLKWQIIVDVWKEMLCHAASVCKGRHHAQLLRHGGEFFTHVWLLLAHYGFTDHFQIPRSRPIADAIQW